MTREEFEQKYAACSGLTVQQLHEMGGHGELCGCSEEDCKGQKMVFGSLPLTGRAVVDVVANVIPSELWIVGKSRGAAGYWEFQGVFDTVEKALAACNDPAYFIGPVRLNEALPDDTVSWPGTWFPLAEKEA